MASKVRVMVRVMVRDQCVKGLMWYHGMDGCSVPAAE